MLATGEVYDGRHARGGEPPPAELGVDPDSLDLAHPIGDGPDLGLEQDSAVVDPCVGATVAGQLGDARAVGTRGTGGERLYLRGNFIVSLSNENRAVLRSSSALGSALATVTNSPPPRVIVEYPPGTAAPARNSTFTRDEHRPFEITSVRRESNGQINIFAREVTSE